MQGSVITYNEIMPNLSKIFGKEKSSKKEDVIRETSPENGLNDREISSEDKFYVMSSYGELLDIAIQLQEEGKEVVLSVPESDYKKIGEGIVEKDDNWHNYLGKGWIFVVDGCENADMQDWLRENGELVVGTNKVMAEYENDRQKGQELFKKAGFNQPDSKNFTDFDEATGYVKSNINKRFILKQNGSAPKSLNHLGKFDGNIDMLYHLEGLKKRWNESEYGKVDFDLMEVVEGTEVAVSAFFNGHDWLRDKDGKVVGFLNFEHKKENDGDLGETTGETGTLFYGTDEDNSIFKDIMLLPEIEEVLRETKYAGVFDINGSITKDGFVAFEPTSRFGIPATSYEFIEGLKTSTADLLAYMARGEDETIEIVPKWGMCVVISAKPFPVEADLDDEATSIGEKLWILDNEEPIDDFKDDQLKHIHLENFYKDEEGNYHVATKNGYLLVVTGTGKDIKDSREKISEYIKNNLYISGMKYRQDIGKRIEESDLKLS